MDGIILGICRVAFSKGNRHRNILSTAVLLLGVCSSAGAVEISTGNNDVKINWDNTVRYTLSQRVKGQNSGIINSVNTDDGDRNFNVGIVSSRLDLLSEMDVVYKKDFGIRLSGAGWYDPVYRAKLDNNSVGTSNHFVNGQQAIGLNSETKDQFGLDAELLDAFAFAKFYLGEVPLNIRAGRHTIFWGEAFFSSAGSNGISYAQSPIDMAKGLAMPGVELKEIFRPLNQVSFQVQPTPEITVAGQYYLQWESNTFPEGGSYLGPIDGLLNSGESFILAPGFFVRNSGDHKPRQSGDWGVKVAYNPEALQSSFGLYYRNFSDKMPQVLGGNYILTPSGPAPTTYHFDYKSDIDLYGISFAKKIMGISVGSELSYRRNMPLASAWFAPEGARGNTMHAVLNFMTLLPKTSVFDTGSAILEFAYGRLDSVTSGSQFYTGYNGYSGIDHATRDNSTVSINVTPQWFQVIPGVDMSMPLNFSVGMHGNAATLTGGADGSGSYSGGLSFDVFAKYKIDLTYASFFGNVHPNAQGQILPAGLAAPGEGAADATALLRDRDLLSLTIKASF
ncbi:MAG: DUF1302 family protein [Desulfuromonadaceae bacterium]|nr:DUF1302 family protein [Desulfuromonadaceae bacterium]